MSVFLWSNNTLSSLAADDSPDIIVVLPGADMALHKVELTETTPARQRLEAEMLASDRHALPTEEVQVAIGPLQEGACWLAIMARSRLADTCEAIRAAGVEPTVLVPAALLLPEGSTDELDGLRLFHGQQFAGAFAPELAAALPESASFRPSPFPPNPLPLPLLNLLQGDFRPQRRWWRARRFQWQAAALALLAAALLLLPAGVQRWRTTANARALDRETMALADRSLPKEAPFTDAGAAAHALDAARTAREARTLGAPLAYVAQNLASMPGVALSAITMTTDGPAFTFEGPAMALNTLASRLQSGPFATTREGARFTFTGRPSESLATATGRFLAASRDAALLKGVRPPRALSATDVQAALQAAGLSDTGEVAGEVVVPAARTPVLLPLLLTLEKEGLRFRHLTLQRNSDQTVALHLTPMKVPG